MRDRGRPRGLDGAPRARGARPAAEGLALRPPVAVAAALAAACTVPDAPPVDDEAPVTVADLWAGAPTDGEVVTVDVVVTSPRTGTAFYAAAPDGGAHSGVRVELAGALPLLPPAVGTLVTVSGAHEPGDVPAIVVNALEDVVVHEAIEPVVVPASDDPGLVGALVRMDGLTVTSWPDPTGRADTDGVLAIAGAFGVVPGYATAGDLVGVVTEPGRVSPRTTDDWTGGLEPAASPATVPLDDVRDLPAGAPVEVEGILATPWSTSGRWIVLQDDFGRGVWVDTEGFDLDRSASEGDRVRWIGEVRADAGFRLRTWWDPAVVGAGVPFASDRLDDGHLATVTVTPAGETDAYGRRATEEGLVLGDRFAPVDALAGPVTVLGAVRVEGDVVELHPLP